MTKSLQPLEIECEYSQQGMSNGSLTQNLCQSINRILSISDFVVTVNLYILSNVSFSPHKYAVYGELNAGFQHSICIQYCHKLQTCNISVDTGVGVRMQPDQTGRVHVINIIDCCALRRDYMYVQLNALSTDQYK